MSEERSCSGAICRSKPTSYNIFVKSDVMWSEKRRESATDIACAIHISEIMLHYYFEECTGNLNKGC
jgi:hypothetical protein